MMTALILSRVILGVVFPAFQEGAQVRAGTLEIGVVKLRGIVVDWTTESKILVFVNIGILGTN